MFGGITNDPCKMWAQLESLHLQRRSGARLYAYAALFFIQKLPDEFLQALMAGVDHTMQESKELHDVEFTLDKIHIRDRSVGACTCACYTDTPAHSDELIG